MSSVKTHAMERLLRRKYRSLLWLPKKGDTNEIDWHHPTTIEVVLLQINRQRSEARELMETTKEAEKEMKSSINYLRKEGLR